MPATSIWITNEDLEKRLMFVTQVYDEGGFTLNIYGCDENFIPMGTPITKELVGDEESYHKSLRKDAEKRGQYVPGHSTNPEWNPGYVAPSEETGGHYGC